MESLESIVENPQMTLVIYSTPGTTTVELKEEDNENIVVFEGTGSAEVSLSIVQLVAALMDCPHEVVPTNVTL